MNELIAAGVVGTAFSLLRRKYIRWKNKRKPRSGTFRRRLLHKYGKKCMVCGSRKKIEAHHIDPKGEGGSDDIENGILLCHRCHVQAHRGKFSRWYLKRRISFSLTFSFDVV